MAGLNSLVTNQQTEATTLPSWYSTAQQNVVNQALGTTAPTQEQTVAPAAISSAFGPGGSFGQATNTLQQIASGAANPWLVSSTGQVTPNVNTALGGLFQAQTDYANKMMPDIEAAATAPYISGGGFGSRMNIGAAERAKGQFLSDLFQKQMTSALQGQQTGATAGLSAAEATNKAIQDAIAAATFQQNAPFSAPTNLAAIIGKLGQQPTTKTTSAQLGGLNQIMGLLAAAKGAGATLGGTGGILEQLGIKSGLPGLWQYIKGTGSSTTTPTTNVPDSAYEVDNMYNTTPDSSYEADNWNNAGYQEPTDYGEYY